MAQINPALPDVLENRYASEHVGGAFDAKNLSQPKSVEQALTDATFGRKPDQSLMLEGQDTRRYIKHDDIIPEANTQSTSGPRSSLTKVVLVTRTPSRKSVAAKSVTPGQNPKTVVVSSTIRPKPLLRPSSYIAMASPGQFPARETVTRPGVRPQPLVRPSGTPRPAVTPGQHFGIPARRPEPTGVGKPGTPSPRPFSPTPPLPFVPVDRPKPKLPIYWDTDPDIWDVSKFIGQTWWNF